MERLDKLLANTGRWSRREVKELVRRGQVRVDGVIAAAAEQKITPSAAVTVSGEPVALGGCTYLLLHKPAGVLTATEDRRQPTVLDLLPTEYRRIGVAPVGRSGQGHHGLLLLTDDGELAHRLLSPKVPRRQAVFGTAVDGAQGQADVEAPSPEASLWRTARNVCPQGWSCCRSIAASLRCARGNSIRSSGCWPPAARRW